MANANNIAGHQTRLDHLKQHLPPDKVGAAYVGGGDRIDPAIVGYMEEEAIRRHRSLDGAYVIDVGCGIGRLTKYLMTAGIARYLGTDILPEILEQARALTPGQEEFQFRIVRDFTIPEADGQADIVCGFSLITHLLDEEVFLYFRETARVLKPNGIAVFSYLDFKHPIHQRQFLSYVDVHKVKRDLLKLFERDTLCKFADMVGMRVIESIDGGKPFPASGKRTMLSNGQPAPSSVTSGQSLIFLERI
jgi:2-polyprenyl-3-methyl-5-hydroxy-6-metoxy-1,4-benzoquinol methylase